MIYGSGSPSSIAKSGLEYTDTQTGFIYIQKDNPFGNNWEIINRGTQTVSAPNTFFHCKTVQLNYDQIISAETNSFEILRINSGENGIINLLNIVSAFETSLYFNNMISTDIQIYDYNTSKTIAQVPGNSGIYGTNPPNVNFSTLWRTASSLNQSSVVKLSPNDDLVLYYKHTTTEAMVGGAPDFKLNIYFIYTLG